MKSHPGVECSDYTGLRRIVSDTSKMRHHGTISSWKDDRGFGFITPKGGGKEIFVHIKAFTNRQRRPLGGELVSFVVKTDAGGKTRAERVSFQGDSAEKSTSTPVNLLLLNLAVVFLAVVGVAGLLRLVPFGLFLLYALASSITFLVYGFDKSAARNNRWRTSEGALHILSLLGGWPGALAAQELLRHKSKKQAFRLNFWITVVGNLIAVAWFLIGDGLNGVF